MDTKHLPTLRQLVTEFKRLDSECAAYRRGDRGEILEIYER